MITFENGWIVKKLSMHQGIRLALHEHFLLETNPLWNSQLLTHSWSIEASKLQSCNNPYKHNYKVLHMTRWWEDVLRMMMGDDDNYSDKGAYCKTRIHQQENILVAPQRRLVQHWLNLNWEESTLTGASNSNRQNRK